jgi:hypothetical protein
MQRTRLDLVPQQCRGCGTVKLANVTGPEFWCMDCMGRRDAMDARPALPSEFPFAPANLVKVNKAR